MFNHLKAFLSKPTDEAGVISKQNIVKYLPQNPIIVEAGAFTGKDTVEMAKVWRNSKIFSFEPIPKIYRKLVFRTMFYKNVKTFQAALSNETGSSKIFVSSGRSKCSSSLLTPKEHLNIHPDVSFEKEIEVKTITLDDWAKQNQIEKVDFLWLDLQGLELAVLKKGCELLKSVKAIYTEVSLIENYKGGALYPELKNWLDSFGFKVAREELAWSDGGNVLFIREDKE